MSGNDLGRDQTDESLSTERDNTDKELARRRESVERSADAVVMKARNAADEVLETARESADAKHQGPCKPSVAAERSLADGLLESERASADENVRRERRERKRALANLLRFEREETDQHLFTERGRSDEALDTRDIFLAMVSHDLRTLLGGIAMSAEILTRDAPGDASKIVAQAATIQRLTARMNRLIGDLVDMASIEAGRLRVAPAPGDLGALIRESVEVFRPSAAAHGLTLEAQIGEGPLRALFDHERILQVLANLLGNAIKFSPRGGRISIQAASAGREARVSVIDSGPGIPAGNLEAIFGKFWQVGRHDRRGLGLGLYISRCILEAHGGRIRAESSGAGSRFTFALPAA